MRIRLALARRGAWLALAAAAWGLPAVAQDALLVKGVPFVGWRSVAEGEYEHKASVNPSIEAARRMVLGYWHDDLRTDADFLRAREQGDELRWVSDPGLSGLAAALRKGSPVIVSLPLTRYAHPASPMWLFSSALFGKKLEPADGPSTYALGPLLPAKALRGLRKATGSHEQLTAADYRASTVASVRVAADRVVVGLDEARGVVIVHDPSFGPALELPLGEFLESWKLAPWMLVMEPADASSIVARHAADPQYRARTPDERAAWFFVLGHTQAATKRLEEAETALRSGLAVPGVSDGYRFLLEWELAPLLCSMRRVDEAVRHAEAAVALQGDLPATWRFLAEHYPMTSRHDRNELARAAKVRAQEAATSWRDDPAVRERVDRFLPADFALSLRDSTWAPARPEVAHVTE